MTGKQENKLSMFVTVREVVSSFESEWSSLPKFVEAFDDFKKAIEDIRATRLIQETHITGYRENKEKAMLEAIERALNIAGIVHAYATEIEDYVLREKVSYSKSDLKNSRDEILVDMLGVIYEAADSVKAELTGYGIDQSGLDNFKSLIDAYADIAESPRVAKTEKKDATLQLKIDIKNGDKILKNRLDMLMSSFKASSPNFYQQYQNARIIIDLGVRHKKDDENHDEEIEP